VRTAITTIVTGHWRENTYLITAIDQTDAGTPAISIDPGNNFELIEAHMTSQHAKPLAILNTHGHYDHISAVADVKKKWNVPFYLHSQDHKLLKSANFYRKIFEEDRVIEIPEVDYFFERVQNPLQIGGFTIEVIETPGHTPGSVCLLVNGTALFTGDTIFKNNVGRTDLPGGNKEQLRESIRKIVSLNPQLTVYPGHGSSALLSEIRRDNKDLKELIK
jgi:hydroxyacylglutathione hydrolase